MVDITPTNWAAKANELLRRMGAAKREHDALAAQYKRDANMLADRYTPKLAELAELVDTLHNDLKQLAIRNRASFKGKKSVKLPAGSFGWKKSPDSVEWDRDDLELVSELMRHGMRECIKTKDIILKTPLKQYANTVLRPLGVHITKGGEKFFARASARKATIPDRTTSDGGAS